MAYSRAGDSESFIRTRDMLKDSYPASDLNKKLESVSTESRPASGSSESSGTSVEDLEALSPPGEILPLIDGN